jgi:hypothetical protein
VTEHLQGNNHVEMLCARLVGIAGTIVLLTVFESTLTVFDIDITAPYYLVHSPVRLLPQNQRRYAAAKFTTHLF